MLLHGPLIKGESKIFPGPLSPAHKGHKGAGGHQLPSAAVHGQDHSVHPGPQPLHLGNQEVAASDLACGMAQ